MESYEKLGAFYLGRRYDPVRRELDDGLLLYDGKDLVTHAVCVGMTGSGKTGLGAVLLEEAAIDGLPALVIDPKGDLGNLLLTFPELSPADFRPWIDEDEARRRELTPDDFAGQQAELWRGGLERWGQGGERIRRLRQAADFRIYTPGSSAGLPVSILASFAPPSAAVLEDADLLSERISSTAGSLLGLLGIDADPIRSREHILLSNLLEHMWRRGTAVDLGGLIRAIQSPPLERIGVLDVDTFFPARERAELALSLNNLLAAPGFQSWLEGQPLDVGRLLYTPDGRPRVAIFSIAHLGDAERMFFVSLLLGEVLSWVRSRPGTSSLRALLYMDEIFGFLPPVAEPPSKKPLLTLLKQARAYGLGLVLATQNPVDLDYKALSNAGTWFIGRLQTERDKRRLLEGLEGIGDAAAFDRAELDALISGLGKRVFLLHNVHEEGPAVFQTRWAMSYLRGPLTRDQIRRLTDEGGHRDEIAESGRPAGAPASSAAPAAEPTGAALEAPPPALPGDVLQLYLPAPGDGPLYEPCLLGLAEVRYVDRRSKREVHSEELCLLLPLHEEQLKIDWDEAEESDLGERDLEREPAPGAAWVPPPVAAGRSRSYSSWRRELADHLYRSRSCELYRSEVYGLTSEPLESEGRFRVRLAEKGREVRDAAVAELRKRQEKKVRALEERLRRARQRLDKEKEQAGSEKLRTVVAAGTTLLAALTGRKKLSYTTLSRAASTVRGLGRASEQAQDVDRAEESIEALTEELERYNAECQAEIDALEARYEAATEELETIALRPRRADVEVHMVALAWRPQSGSRSRP